MLFFLRRFFVDSWVGKILAFLLFLTFMGWGINDVVLQLERNSPDTVVHVGNRRVSDQDYARALRSRLSDYMQQTNITDQYQIPVGLRQQLASQTLGQIIIQNELLNAADRYGLRVSDEVLRNEVFQDPIFHNADNIFDRNKFNDRLRALEITQENYLRLLRDDLAIRGVVLPIVLSAHLPQSQTERMYAAMMQVRRVDMVVVPLDLIKTVPSAEESRRYFNNHPWDFRTPEFRHVKIVLLSPNTLSRFVQVNDEDLRRAYEAKIGNFRKPPVRSLELLILKNESRAKELTELWKKVSEWATVKAAIGQDAAVLLQDTTPSDIPTIDLANLIFQTPVNQIMGPTKTQAGWVVFRITKAKPASETSFSEARQQLEHDYIYDASLQMMSDRLRKLQDVLAAGDDLGHLPVDIGAAVFEGTLDPTGHTVSGKELSLPSSPDLRRNILERVFTQEKGAMPVLISGPDNAYYAVSVENIDLSRQMTEQEAYNRVIKGWQKQRARRIADQRATAIYLKSLEQGNITAAADGNAIVKRNVDISSQRPLADGFSETMVGQVSSMKVGETLMWEEADKFVVVTLKNVTTPKPGADDVSFQQLKSTLESSYAGSIELLLAQELSNKEKPRINVMSEKHISSAIIGE